MGNYAEFAEKALASVGGIENLSHVTHCATRVRITYKSNAKVDKEAWKSLPKCAGVVDKDHQVQFIIGPNVGEAYYDFCDVAKWNPNSEADGGVVPDDDEDDVKDLKWFLNKFGNFMAPIFMPVVPAMIVGGMILAFRNLLMNYFGMKFSGGTYWMVMAIFNAGFNFLPIYVGYETAKQLRIQPILGAMLGALLLSSYLPDVTDIFGIPVTQASYGSTVLPVLLGCIVMSPIYKFWKRVVPEAITFFVTPILTMIIIVPLELLILGPFGQMLSGYIAKFCMWITSSANIVAQPLLAALYPYMVMFGLDKGLAPIGIELISNVGYNAVTAPMGFISNICVGGSALAVATTIKDDVAKKGMITSFGVTALCGVTEPAFYGALITKPIALGGTAIGAVCGGVLAAILNLRTFVQGGCPGWLTLVFFIDMEGNPHYMWCAIAVAAVSTVVSFVAAKALLTLSEKKVK